MPPHAIPSDCLSPWPPSSSPSASYFHGALIIGAGPAGLATAACLHQHHVPALLLEQAPCIASLWQHKVYDRLHLHLPKQFCELPLLPFPRSFPAYPSRHQFIAYLEAYAAHFGLRPLFRHGVTRAAFEPRTQLWHVQAGEEGQEFRARWLVVASGENADPVAPVYRGVREFVARGGEVMHSCGYRNGREYQGKKVLVVGCGNTGMEIALDLANFGARPTIVVRNPAHVLPREIFGQSTFLVAMLLMKSLPLWLIDKLLVSYTYLTLGDTARVGIPRPKEGPLLLKEKNGKTPILDVGTLALIKTGEIQVRPRVECLTATGAQFEDGRCEDFEAVIWATGYKSNVPKWLKDDGHFFSEDGLPRMPFPHGWKGGSGLYVAGLGRRGILGAAHDARRIAADLAGEFRADVSSWSMVVPAQHQQPPPQPPQPKPRPTPGD